MLTVTIMLQKLVISNKCSFKMYHDFHTDNNHKCFLSRKSSY